MVPCIDYSGSTKSDCRSHLDRIRPPQILSVPAAAELSYSDLSSIWANIFEAVHAMTNVFMTTRTLMCDIICRFVIYLG